MIKLKNVINKHKSNKIKENSNTVRHLNNGTDHRHSKSCCDQSSPARRTINGARTHVQQTSVHCTHAAVQLPVVQTTVVHLPYDRSKLTPLSYVTAILIFE